METLSNGKTKKTKKLKRKIIVPKTETSKNTTPAETTTKNTKTKTSTSAETVSSAGNFRPIRNPLGRPKRVIHYANNAGELTPVKVAEKVVGSANDVMSSPSSTSVASKTGGAMKGSVDAV